MGENIRNLEASFEGTAFERQLVGAPAKQEKYQASYTHCVSSLSGEGTEGLRETIDGIASELDGFGDHIPLRFGTCYAMFTRTWCLRSSSLNMSIIALQMVEGAIGDEQVAIPGPFPDQLLAAGVDRRLSMRCHRRGQHREQLPQLKMSNHLALLFCSQDELCLLLKLFNDIGMLLHHDHPHTRNLVVLKPQWLLDLMRNLLCKRSLHEKSIPKQNSTSNMAHEWRLLLRNGRLLPELLPAIWNELPSAEAAEVLSLMVSFGLAGQIPNVDMHVIPSLLPLYTPTAVGNLFCEESSLSAFITSTYQSESPWGETTPYMPEGVFFGLQSQLLATAGPDVLGNCTHLYKDRLMLFPQGATGADFMVKFLPHGACIQITVCAQDDGLASTGGTQWPAAIAAQVLQCLHDPGIADRCVAVFDDSIPAHPFAT